MPLCIHSGLMNCFNEVIIQYQNLSFVNKWT